MAALIVGYREDRAFRKIAVAITGNGLRDYGWETEFAPQPIAFAQGIIHQGQVRCGRRREGVDIAIMKPGTSALEAVNYLSVPQTEAVLVAAAIEEQIAILSRNGHDLRDGYVLLRNGQIPMYSDMKQAMLLTDDRLTDEDQLLRATMLANDLASVLLEAFVFIDLPETIDPEEITPPLGIEDRAEPSQSLPQDG